MHLLIIPAILCRLSHKSAHDDILEPGTNALLHNVPDFFCGGFRDTRFVSETLDATQPAHN